MALIAHAAQDDILHWCGREAFFREAFGRLDDIERPLAERSAKSWKAQPSRALRTRSG